jgi:ligand-binding sensor domain-containing protein
MAGKVVNSCFVLLSKFSVNRQVSASETATRHIRKSICVTKIGKMKNTLTLKKRFVINILFLSLIFLFSCDKAVNDINEDNEPEEESEWTVYNHTNSPLPSHQIASLFTDKTGLWLCSSNLYHFDGEEWITYDKYNTGLDHHLSFVISGIRTEPNINWFGSWTGLLKKVEDNWSAFTPNNSSIPSIGVNEITGDKDGNLWLATDAGISMFDGIDNFSVYDETNTPIPCRYTKFIDITTNGDVWAGIVYNEQICPEPKIGYLARFKNDTWTIFSSQNSNMPEGDIRALKIDNNDNVWLVIDWELIKFNNTDFDIYDIPISILPSNSLINDIAFDTQNNLWLATTAGILKYENGTWKNITSENPDLSQEYFHIAISEDNTKWFSEFGSELVKYTGD